MSTQPNWINEYPQLAQKTDLIGKQLCLTSIPPKEVGKGMYSVIIEEIEHKDGVYKVKKTHDVTMTRQDITNAVKAPKAEFTFEKDGNWANVTIWKP